MREVYRSDCEREDLGAYVVYIMADDEREEGDDLFKLVHDPSRVLVSDHDDFDNACRAADLCAVRADREGWHGDVG